VAAFDESAEDAEDPEAEVLEGGKAKGPADDHADSPVEAFGAAVVGAGEEVSGDGIDPAGHGIAELVEGQGAEGAHLRHPGFQGHFAHLGGNDRRVIEEGAEFVAALDQTADLRVLLQDGRETFFLGGGKILRGLEKNPAHPLECVLLIFREFPLDFAAGLVDAVVELVLDVEAIGRGFDGKYLANRVAVRFPEVTGDFRELGERAALLFISEPVGDDLF